MDLSETEILDSCINPEGIFYRNTGHVHGNHYIERKTEFHL